MTRALKEPLEDCEESRTVEHKALAQIIQQTQKTNALLQLLVDLLRNRNEKTS
jgi:hypothetical protein